MVDPAKMRAVLATSDEATEQPDSEKPLLLSGILRQLKVAKAAEDAKAIN